MVSLTLDEAKELGQLFNDTHNLICMLMINPLIKENIKKDFNKMKNILQKARLE